MAGEAFPGARVSHPLSRAKVFAVLAGAYAVFLVSYLAVDAWSVGRTARTLFIPGEERLPFVPDTEFVYALAYLLPVLVAWKLTDALRLRRLLVALALTLAVAYATFLLCPVRFDRPVVEVHSLATWLVALEYRLDAPYNLFPSLHVAISWLLWLACRDVVRRRAILLAVVIGISISTVFVKQHYVVDVLAGAALAVAAWLVAGRWLAARRDPFSGAAGDAQPLRGGPG
jgi:membrane-associated phospholipid phosphatase